MDLRKLQDFQNQHDAKFHKDVMSWDWAKQVEHCSFHLSKLAGLFSTYSEKLQHGEPYDTKKLVSDRIPDVLIFALKFANLWKIDLERTYLQRLHDVQARGKT